MKQYRKTGKGYREIFKTPTIDWNDAINGKKLNPFLEITLDMMKKAAPSIFRKFPWTVCIQIKQFTIYIYIYIF